ncbi:MAG: tetratricopeptide repeat protein [Candidatus Auribacterota bacterium]
MNASGISLCMIVKNEEKRINSCLLSISGCVDELIVVDTGSTDATVALAKHAGAVVYEFEFKDSIADARNFALSKARFEWILVLDADERLAARDFPRIRACANDTEHDGFIFFQRHYVNDPDVENWRPNDHTYTEAEGYSGYFDVEVVRMFRNRPFIRYKGHVHELVEESLKSRPKRHSSVPIHHYGLAHGRITSKEKNQQYLELLLKDLNDNPDSFKTRYLLGRQYYQLEKYDDAITHLKKAVSLNAKDASAFNSLGMACIHINRFDDAIDYLTQATILSPLYEEPCFSLGVAYLKKGALRQALDAVRTFLEINPRGVKGLNLIGYIYLQQDLLGMAEQYFRKALSIHPLYALARGNLIKILVAKKDYAGARNEAKLLIETNPDAKNWLTSLIPEE